MIGQPKNNDQQFNKTNDKLAEENFIGEKKMKTEIGNDYQRIKEMLEQSSEQDDEEQSLFKKVQNLFESSKQAKTRSQLDKIFRRLRAIKDDLFVEFTEEQQFNNKTNDKLAEENFIGEKKMKTEIGNDYQRIKEMLEQHFANDDKKQEFLKEAQDLFNDAKQAKTRSQLDKIFHRLRAIRNDLFVEFTKEQQKKPEESEIDKEVIDILKEEFNITKEELEKIKGFNQLSKGQQFLALENLKQWVLGEIQTKSIRDFEQKKQEFNYEGEDNNSKLKSILYGARTLFHSARLNLAKGWKIKKFEKINKDNIKEDEQKEKVKQALSSLVGQMKNTNLQVNLVETKQGKKDIEIQYLSVEQFKESDKTTVDKFNKTATAFSKIPALWGTESYKIISKNEYEEYNQIKNEYEETRGKVLNILNNKNLYNIKANPENKKAKNDDIEKASIGEALKQMNEIDMNVQINQFLNTHPEVEEALLDIDKSTFKRVLGAFFKSEKGMAFTSGILSRYVTKTALLFGSTAATSAVAIPMVTIAGAAGFGAWRGRIRGKEDIKIREKELGRKSIKEKELKRTEREKNLKELSVLEKETALIKDKQGEKYLKKQSRIAELKTFLHTDNKITKERNFVDAKSLTDKIDFMIDKINNSESEEQKNKLINSLKVRINYTKRKIEEGLVNFGNEDEIINNTYNLTSRLSNALNYIGEYEIEEKSGKIQTKGKLEERVSEMLDTKSLKITEQQKKYLKKELEKGMLFGLGFASIGIGLSKYFDAEINKYIDKPIKGVFDKIRGFFINELSDKNLSSAKLPDEEFNRIIREYFENSKFSGQNPKGISQAELNEIIKEHFKNRGQAWDFSQAGKPTTVMPTHNNSGTTNAIMAMKKTSPSQPDLNTGTKVKEFWHSNVDKGDSPLKIAKNIYKEHAQNLGYKGDIKDSIALNKWAEKASARHIVGQYIREHSNEYSDLIKHIGEPPKDPTRLDNWLHKVPKGTFDKILNKEVPNLVFKGDTIEVGQNGDISAFNSSHSLRTGHINIAEKTMPKAGIDIKGTTGITQKQELLDKFKDIANNTNLGNHSITLKEAKEMGINIYDKDGLSYKDITEISFLKHHPEVIGKTELFNKLCKLTEVGKSVDRNFDLSDSLKYHELFKNNLDILKTDNQQWDKNQIEILRHLEIKGDNEKIVSALKFVKNIKKGIDFKTTLAKLKINSDDEGALKELKKILKIDNIKNVHWSSDGNSLIARINRHFWFDKDETIFSKSGDAGIIDLRPKKH